MITDPIGLYVHIPFCLKKCAYCDFCSFPLTEVKSREAYVDALCAEIRSYAGRGVKVDSVFFGGGTPSLLSGAEFRKITDAIRESFVIKEDAEFTLECNPKTLTEENLREYISCGANRISIGLQSIHENELKKLGRIHSFDDFLNTCNMITNYGIKNVSVDLMYGIPGQTLDSFNETLDRILSLSPTHISLYGLIVEEGTYLSEHLSEYDLPSEDEECEMYELAARKLSSEGYIHYEISNYSRGENNFCQHNLKYWRDLEYIGVGVAAYSYFEGKRFGNSRDYDKYIEDFRQCRIIDEKIDLDAEKYEFVMLSLRLSDGFSLDEYKKKFSSDFTDGKRDILEKLTYAGLLKIEDGRVFLTEQGFYVSNSILTELL